MAKSKIRFNNAKGKDFVSTLRARVDSYFTENNLSKAANGAMITKTVSLFAITFIPYFLILFAGLPNWAMLLCCVVMGLGYAGIGFSIGHDALHASYSENPTVNKWLGYSFNLIGANDYLWKLKHNILHHTYTNIFEHDDDLDVSKFLRFSPHAPYHWYHRVQHITAFIGYCLQSMLWVFINDFGKLFQYQGANNPKTGTNHPTFEVVKLIITKALYYTYILIIPMIVLPVPFYYVIIGFVLMHVFAGFTLSIIFQLAHVVEETDHPLPTAEAPNFIDNAWAIHQMETTADFAVKSPIMTWYSGGLNFQVEHHLFPNICSIHYPAIHEILKITAKEFDVRFHYQNSFAKAIGSHYRTLKNFSKPPKMVFAH
ncbi:MAG: acyl-CoA desaturase [Bacteroidetes bacterium]|nr:acyl-CoA desaturase [Bacteroidota bacterium]